MNAPAGRDISAEQRWADDLLAASRIYRQDAIATGEQSMANVLDELERSLIEIVHSPAQVTDADLSGSRRLVLTHRVHNGVLLDKTEAERTLQYLAQLWGYRVKLVETENDSGRVLKEHEALPMP